MIEMFQDPGTNGAGDIIINVLDGVRGGINYYLYNPSLYE